MKMLLYPFEEEFDVPALSIELCDCQWLVSQMVGKEAVNLTGGEVLIGDHPEGLGIVPGWFDPCQSDNLIVDYTCLGISSLRLDNRVQHVVLGSGHKECPVLVDMVEESEEINVTFVQKIYRSHLHAKVVKSLDIVHGSICEMDIYREIASEVEEGMHLHTCFGRLKLCPWAELQTETYGTAVKSIDHVVDIETEWIIRIQRPHPLGEDLTEVPVYTPIPLLVGFCKRVPWDRVAYAAMIQFVLNRNEARFYVPKAILRSVLRKTHYEELVIAGQVPGTIVALVSGNASIEVSARYKIHKLSKYGFSCKHGLTDILVSPKLRFKSCTRKIPCN